MFTGWYAQQSCTAGRAVFIPGQHPFRTGQGIQAVMPTLAILLEPHGFTSGQSGKNHLSVRDEHLPTNHRYDEFFGRSVGRPSGPVWHRVAAVELVGGHRVRVGCAEGRVRRSPGMLGRCRGSVWLDWSRAGGRRDGPTPKTQPASNIAGWVVGLSTSRRRAGAEREPERGAAARWGGRGALEPCVPPTRRSAARSVCAVRRTRDR